MLDIVAELFSIFAIHFGKAINSPFHHFLGGKCCFGVASSALLTSSGSSTTNNRPRIIAWELPKFWLYAPAPETPKASFRLLIVALIYRRMRTGLAF